MSNGSLRGGHVTEDQKRDSASKENFLNTAARAVGSTLGKLAAKTGLALPDVKPKVKAPAGKAAKLVRKPAAKTAGKKKKVVLKKTSRLVTKIKR